MSGIQKRRFLTLEHAVEMGLLNLILKVEREIKKQSFFKFDHQNQYDKSTTHLPKANEKFIRNTLN